jgi:hypothetical protein
MFGSCSIKHFTNEKYRFYGDKWREGIYNFISSLIRGKADYPLQFSSLIRDFERENEANKVGFELLVELVNY